MPAWQTRLATTAFYTQFPLASYVCFRFAVHVGGVLSNMDALACISNKDVANMHGESRSGV